MSERVEYPRLVEFVTALFEAQGLSPEMASVVGGGFIEAELMGFRSHGVVKVAKNLAWLEAGATRASGEPDVLVDRPAVGSWDGERLPGHWLLHLALRHGIERAREAGAYTLTLSRCQHVACLASTLLPAIEARMIVLMMVSSPDEAYVSPFGGSGRLFSNNPIAFTAPRTFSGTAAGWPVLFDLSMAITAGSQVARAAGLGRKLPEPAIRTAAGGVSDDPADFQRGGAVMPMGGLTHGYKGHALTLMTEVLTQGLTGHGRSQPRPESELNNVYLQVLDPAAFARPSDYEREVGHLVCMVEASVPDDADRPVRVPGRRAWELREAQMRDGVLLDPGTLEALLPYAQKLGVPTPGHTASE